ncbi:MAG: hypothetical protein QOG09_280 [Solirubrobacterales bacterium]|jgi:hypothetical protein|nr:hypothetical protein [Solirubrobacterales bacterium]
MPLAIPTSLSTRIRTLPARHGKHALAILALIVAVGLALRADRAILNPVENPGVDANTYASIARSLYVDHTYGKTVMDSSDWSPGAPLLYAGVYYLTGGEHVGAARLLVALLGTLTILVVYLLGRRLGGTATGLLAAALVAIYPYFVFDAGRLMSEPLGCLALASAVLSFLWALEQRSAWAWTAPGLLLGITALARPEYLMFAPILAIVALVIVARRAGRRPGLAAAALLVCAFLVPVLPWLVRDYVVLDRVVPISTGGGKALFIGTFLPGDGNHFKTKLFLYRRFHPQSRLSDDAILAKRPRPILDRVAARYPELSRDAALAKIGRENLKHDITEEPLAYAGMLARKTGRMWTPSGRSMHPALPTVLHYCLLALALAALIVLARRRRIEALVIGLIVLGITATGALLLAGTRRNVVLMPLVITLASFAATWLGALLRDARGRSPAAVYPARP